MRIVVAGLPKSGTTALYAKLRNSLPGRTSCHFECHAAPEVAEADCDHVLVKVLYKSDNDHLPTYRGYDHRIAILRDPRDRLVSAVLYAAGMHGNYPTDEEKVASMVALLEAKEAGADVPLLAIVEQHRRCEGRPAPGPGGFTGLADLELAAARDLADWFTVRYCDLAAGDFAALEAHLGLDLAGTTRVDAEHGRVVRAGRPGNWRHWFTPQDVAVIRPSLDPVLAALGWDPDWALAAEPDIAPRHGSQYYLRLIAESRALAEAQQRERQAPDFARRKDEALAAIMGPEWLDRRRRTGDR